MNHNVERITNMNKDEWKHSLDKNDEYSKLYKQAFASFKRETNAYYYIYNKTSELYHEMCNHPENSERYIALNARRGKLHRIMYEKEKSMKLLDLEVTILSDYLDHYLSIANRHMKTSVRSRTNFFTKKFYSVKQITKAKRQQVEKEICAICCQTHLYKDLIETTCGHVFGKPCYQQYIESNKAGNIGCCPMCRTKDYDFLVYSLRK